MGEYDRVKDLHSWRSGWKIQVKVLRKWRKVTEDDATIELILCDAFVDKIETTITEDLFEIFDHEIEENDWKILSTFSVCYNDRRLKHTDCDYRIRFINETTVENSAVISNNHFYDFQSFDRVFEEYHAVRNLPLDIMGEVVNVEPFLNVHDPNAEMPHEMIRILRFLSGVDIPCLAYNDLADYFYNNWWSTGCHHVVAVLQFWHVKYQSGGNIIKLYDLSGRLFDSK
ncbi:PREDICTED: uncharacterized protein LOC104790707 [Camelina sativa]|uniref:Uncharacterized protein LOC104790707 n=1 Tax=Camelina sativa TaxID=90675 RepID=A0ABM1RS65_CAMSA|nr:PREDICTED: uncharacterized protein LOC104790707 [Camelina sativa]